MPIILAIEPDRRQAAHLTGVVRQKVAAELILAETTEGALDAIGNRVPDMVLVPALLSPQDDAALAAALRVIAAAAHVRTLTIPVLANGTKRSKPGGMLAKWRRGRAESPAPDGCDPSVFAEQINAYLKEAAAERAALESELDDAAGSQTDPIDAAQPFEMATPAPIAFLAPDPIAVATPEPFAFATPEPFAFATPEPFALATPEPFALATPAPMESRVVEPIEAWADEPIEPLAAIEPIEQLAAVAFVEDESTHVWSDGRVEPAESDAPPEASVDGLPDIDLSEELNGLADESVEEELFAGEPVGVYTISSAVDETAVDAFDVLPAILEPAPIAQHAEASVVNAGPEEAFLEPALIEASVAEGRVVEALVSEASVAEEHVVEALVIKAPVVEKRVVEWRVVEYLVEEDDVVEDIPAEKAATPRSDVEPWMPMYLTPGRMWPPLEGVLVEAATSLDESQPDAKDDSIAAFVQAEIAQPEARPELRTEAQPETRPEVRPDARPEPLPEARPVAASPKPDHPEWLELVASLRQDIERRRGETASLSAQTIAARAVDSGNGDGNHRVKKQKLFGKKSKPVQDEWGFFDPEQCGFSALLAKLEEITDAPDESDTRRPS